MRSVLVLLLCATLGVVTACATDIGGQCTAWNCANDSGNAPEAGQDGTIQLPDSGGPTATFDVQPGDQTIKVACNQPSPTVLFTATATNGGGPVAVAWSVDRPEIGTMSSAGPSPQSTFTPTGTTGGQVEVIAQYQGQTIIRHVLVQLSCGQQNGNCPSSQIATNTSQLLSGGGIGGVGGEGCGGAVTDTQTLNALQNPSGDGSAQGLKLLYPYDRTVWPRGLLAPLLQWDWTFGNADAIKIDLTTTSKSFTWSGTFAAPAILSQETAPFTGMFIRHPIPQDIWQMATNSAGTMINNQRDQLTVKITLAYQGQGYGPITETWDVAPAKMAGTVYYQTYGTKYATSSWGMGAATLAIKPGATSPTLVTSSTRCQACHSVAAKGARLTTDDSPSGDYDDLYDLKTSTSTQMPAPPDQYTWGAITPDATLVLSNAGPKWGSPNYGMEGSVQTPSALFSLPGGSAAVTSAQIATQLGLTSPLWAMMPAFSPDGKHAAFNFWQGGPGTDGKNGDGLSLAAMDFDETSQTFANLHTVYTPTQTSTCTAPTCKTAVWPSFLPTSDGIVFELQLTSDGYEIGGDSNTAHYTGATYTTTLEGTRGELWWLDLKTMTAHRLDVANGAGYVPAGPNEHNDDTTVQYQPTVAPIASGGYAWVVFSSRRLYGNVATLNPWWSDTQRAGAWQTQPMTKKLWMVAIDLNAPAGTDPSHPAFYLPAQELMAGNSRAYWVLDPCKANGASCATGDQCCGGHCVTSTDGGAPVCGTPSGCGNEGDTCTSDTDCCSDENLHCVGGPDNGHCDVKIY